MNVIVQNAMEAEVQKASTNFEPLLDFLSIEGASSNEIAKVFDALLYDYSFLSIVVQQSDFEPKHIVREEAEDLTYWIKEFRNVFRKCRF